MESSARPPPRQPPLPQDPTPAPAGYWRRVRRLTVALLLVWVLTAFVLIWHARALGAVRFFGWPLGFWVAAQGALFVFLAIVVVYAWAMARLDRAHGGTELE